MESSTWYWEYRIKIWNSVDYKEEMRAGIVAAATFTEAMQEIEDYYAEELMEVHMLKAIIEGVFDFKYAVEDCDFDYEINEKSEKGVL